SCRRLGSAQCKKLFECLRSVAELQYGTEANCVSQFNKQCEAFRNYECDDLSAYERCIDSFSQSGCGTLQPGSSACSGNLTASCATTTTTASGGCTVTLSQCSDNRVYTLSCSGSACTCSDGASNRSVIASCGVRSSAIATCGWNVQP